MWLRNLNEFLLTHANAASLFFCFSFPLRRSSFSCGLGEYTCFFFSPSPLSKLETVDGDAVSSPSACWERFQQPLPGCLNLSEGGTITSKSSSLQREVTRSSQNTCRILDFPVLIGRKRDKGFIVRSLVRHVDQSVPKLLSCVSFRTAETVGLMLPRCLRFIINPVLI